MAKKERTLEERLKAAKKVAKKNLDNDLFVNVAGFNEVNSNRSAYGELNAGNLGTVMTDKDIVKDKKEAYDQTVAEAESLGVYGTPSLLSDADYSLNVMKTLEESMNTFTFGELRDFVKSKADGFDIYLPEEVEDYNIQEFMKDIQGKIINKEEISQVEKELMSGYNVIKGAYMRSAALKVTEGNNYADLNAEAERIFGKYKPKKETNKDDKTEGDEE